MNSPRSVLVTGASSGIGRATARRIAAAGMTVFAGVRRISPDPEAFQEILLDVTDPASIDSARLEIESQLGGAGLDGLVNNAGIGDIRPLEFTPPDDFRRVFDVNVFGVIAVTQAFLPLLHRAGGRIVNMGSVGGMVTIPFAAALTASKHAIESISDALRLELYAAGISVTCLQPASINSGSAEKLAAQTEKTIDGLPADGRRRYGDVLRAFTQTMLRSETSGSPPEAVAEAVLEVLRAARPPSRRLVGKDRYLLKFLARGLPDRLRDALFRRIFLGHPAFASRPAEAAKEET